MEVEHLLSVNNWLGEGPLWSAVEQALYWVDIRSQRIERFQPASKHRQSWQMEQAVTAIGFRQAGGFVAATDRGFALWDGNSTTLTLLTNPEQDRPFFRFNDGKVDPAGRFWAGSMYAGPAQNPRPDGRLFRLDEYGQVSLQGSGYTISNGMGWSPDNRYFYFTDTLRKTILRFDYDPSTGEICNPQPLVQDLAEPGYPDGMTVDTDGCLWSARWGGWKVIRYDSQGKKMGEIALPVEQPSSCVFGGPNFETLYVTSAWEDLSPEARAAQRMAGDLFCIHGCGRGFAEHSYRG